MRLQSGRSTIDYALKLRKSIQRYEAISKPVTQEAKEKKKAITGSLKYADARKKKQEPKKEELNKGGLQA